MKKKIPKIVIPGRKLKAGEVPRIVASISHDHDSKPEYLGLHRSKLELFAAATYYRSLAIKYGAIIDKKIEKLSSANMMLLQMWNDNYQRSEIAARLNIAPDTITNLITILRKELGPGMVPYDKERRRRIIRKS